MARFEVLYQERYGALTPLQRANLTRAYQNAVETGIGLECPADALMAWGVHTGLTDAMLDDWHVIERLLFDYDGDMPGAIEKLYLQITDMMEGN